MKEHIRRYVNKNHIFNKEFKRQLRLLITVAMGFTIAFTWRQTIYDLSLTFLKFITKIQDISALKILTSILITIFAFLIIYLSARYLGSKPEWK